mmetsp:Transcript_8983/g.26420  ORF Transcript_8983/g.26420 Transcript_8983/m.26420 type:complete len:386 (-) Transcript_8983:9-1166(-)
MTQADASRQSGKTLLHYDPGSGYVTTLFRLANTVVPHVLRRFEFWVFFVLHLLVTALYRGGYLRGADEKDHPLYIQWKEMRVITGITTFFEVFYTNQCYSRYCELYQLTRALLGILYDFTLESRIHLRQASKGHTRLTARWLAASVVLFFYESQSEVSEREWQELLRHGLVTDEEKRFLEPFSRHQRSHIVLHWNAMAVRDGQAVSKMPANAMKSLIDKLLRTRGLQQRVADIIDLPIPFQYFHLLRMMVVVNLVLWAYGMGVTQSIFSPIVYFCAALIFMGMMELATQLSDPFGDDEVDFPVNTWLSEVLENVATLVEVENPFSLEQRLQMEQPLQRGRRDLNLFVRENLSSGGGQKRGWGSSLLRRGPEEEEEDEGEDDDGED